MKNSKNSIFILIFVTTMALFYSCAVNPVTGKKELMLVSESQEKAMGLQSDPSIIASYGMYQNEEMQKFIDVKGQEMAAISHRSELDYKFRILDSPVVNAFAVPGGFVYFTRGIMAHFNNEAEFAGVLGHEIGHITARHSARQMSQQQLLGGLFVAGMVVSEDFRQFSDLAGQGLGMLFLKFGRDHESQSDGLGVDYSTKVGYDAHEMANFFGVLARMQKDAGVNIPTWQSTHPDPADRYNKVHALANKAQNGIPKENLKINRNSYLRMIDGLVYGEDPRQGFVENNNFYHPELKFQFPLPNSWRVANTPSMVQIAEPNGKAVMLMSLAAEKDLDAAAKATVEQDKLQVVESGRTSVNGLQAIAMVSEQQNQNQQTGQTQVIRILTYLIQYEGLIYKFHGLSTGADFNRYHSTFNNTMKNFRSLHDPNKINRQPERIKIQTVPRTMSLASALNQFKISGDRHNELAVLNNMKLNDQLQAGTLIKTLEIKGSTTSTSPVLPGIPKR